MSLGKLEHDVYSPKAYPSPPGLGYVKPHPSLSAATNGFAHADHEIRKDIMNHSVRGPYSDGTTNDTALARYLHVEQHPNGGATIVHMYQDEFNHLKKEEMTDLAREFFREVFREEPNGVACHVMGIVHNAIPHVPELVSYLAIQQPDLVVKVGNLSNLRKNEIETVKMEEYGQRVEGSYSHGTFRCGPLLQLSVVGQVAEESGGYFPQLLGMYVRVCVCEEGGRECVRVCL
jgi:hypothetical protein